MPRYGTRLLVLLALCAVAGGVPPDVAADRAFGPRFSVNTQGDITIAANSIMSCLDSLAACANVRNGVGTGLNNNNRTMTWIDADSDPATFDSSSADLVMPAGGEGAVRRAVLRRQADRRRPAGRRRRTRARTTRSSSRLRATRRYHDADRPSTGRRRRRRSTRGSSNVTSIVDGGRRGHLLDRERAARHRAERRAVRRLGARRRLRGPGRPEPQPLGLRRNADRLRQPRSRSR